MGFSYNVNVLNQKGSPALYTDTFANRPPFGYAGRLFIANDTSAIYEDTGTSWVLIANVSSGAGTLQQVTTNGNTSNVGISITAGGLSTNSLTDTALTLGSVLFSGAAGLVTQDNAAFFWDDTNNRLGINTTTPTNTLDLHFAGTGAMLGLNNTTGGNQSAIVFSNGGANKWRIGNSTTNTFDFYNNVLAAIAYTINGANNGVTFNENIKIKQGRTLYAEAGVNSIACDSGGFFFQLNTNVFAAYFNLIGLTAGRTYTFPNTSGTIALTSDIPSLTGYVPYNGATANLVLGNFNLLSSGFLLNQTSGTGAIVSGYTTIRAQSFGGLYGFIIDNGTTGINQQLLFPDSTSYAYTFPNNSGTLATVANLSSYLPLTGGTLTGTLNGTRADFSNRLNVNGATDDGTTALNVTGNAKFSSTVTAQGGASSGFVLNYNTDASSRSWSILNDQVAFGDFQIQQSTTQTGGTRATKFYISSGGNILINSTTDDTVNKLQVTGSAKITSSLSIGSTSHATVSVSNQDTSTINLSTIFPTINFVNFISLQLQIVSTNGGTTNYNSSIINCARNGNTTWSYSLVSSVGTANIITITFGGTQTAPTIALSGSTFSLFSVIYQIIVR